MAVGAVESSSTHMMKLAEASQELVVRGQQTGFEFSRVHPVVQSWIAPKEWPGDEIIHF